MSLNFGLGFRFMLRVYMKKSKFNMKQLKRYELLVDYAKLNVCFLNLHDQKCNSNHLLSRVNKLLRNRRKSWRKQNINNNNNNTENWF